MFWHISYNEWCEAESSQMVKEVTLWHQILANSFSVGREVSKPWHELSTCIFPFAITINWRNVEGSVPFSTTCLVVYCQVLCVLGVVLGSCCSYLELTLKILQESLPLIRFYCNIFALKTQGTIAFLLKIVKNLFQSRLAPLLLWNLKLVKFPQELGSIVLVKITGIRGPKNSKFILILLYSTSGSCIFVQ